MLCFLMGQFLNVDLDKLQAYARAAEFVHAATLAHDDVIDESLIRRNRPTLNARVSNARAVLAGDLLLARVMAELSLLGEVRLIHELSLTVEELVHGEWLQLEARKVAAIHRPHLETVAKKKNGKPHDLVLRGLRSLGSRKRGSNAALPAVWGILGHRISDD